MNERRRQTRERRVRLAEAGRTSRDALEDATADRAVALGVNPTADDAVALGLQLRGPPLSRMALLVPPSPPIDPPKDSDRYKVADFGKAQPLFC